MKNISFKIGMTAIEVIVELVRAQPEIKYLNFDIYAPSLNLKELTEKPDFTRLLAHRSSNFYYSLGRTDLTEENMKSILSCIRKNEVIAVRSDVIRVSGRTYNYYHIPMMDFVDGISVRKIKDFLSAIGSSNGVILSSGRSYHYYGLGLLDKREWYNFLADCLFSGIADVRYIGHRLKDEYGVLRISACPLRPKIPKVVAVL